jgi:drug/metabolite transporter (DMT)-like permease
MVVPLSQISGPAARCGHTSNTTPRDGRLIAALLVIWVVWGSTYFAISIAVKAGIPPALLIGARFLLAGLVLGVIARASRERFPTRREWLGGSVVGILMLAGGVGTTAFAQLTNSSSLTTMIVASGPF